VTNTQFKPDDSVGYRYERIPPDQPDCPYLDRWVIGVGVPGRKSWFSLRLHHFFRSDEDHLHDHPAAFLTLVLKGAYDDVVGCRNCDGKGVLNDPFSFPNEPCGFCLGTGRVVGDHMSPGSVRFRPALHAHRVVTEGCWTLVLFGPRKRDWGFYAPEGWIRQRLYFKRYGGAAACREVNAEDHD
jgi:hypothetical protein